MGCLLHWREEMGCERAASPACTARDARRTVSAQLPRQWERHDRQRLRPACRPARGRRVGSRQRQRPPCDSRRRDEASSRQRPWPQQRAASVAPALRGRGAAQQRGPGRARARRALSVSAAADRPAGKVCPDMCSPDRPASPRAAPDSGRLQAQGRPPPRARARPVRALCAGARELVPLCRPCARGPALHGRGRPARDARGQPGRHPDRDAQRNVAECPAALDGDGCCGCAAEATWVCSRPALAYPSHCAMCVQQKRRECATESLLQRAGAPSLAERSASLGGGSGQRHRPTPRRAHAHTRAHTRHHCCLQSTSPSLPVFIPALRPQSSASQPRVPRRACACCWRKRYIGWGRPLLPERRLSLQDPLRLPAKGSAKQNHSRRRGCNAHRARPNPTHGAEWVPAARSVYRLPRRATAPTAPPPRGLTCETPRASGSRACARSPQARPASRAAALSTARGVSGRGARARASAGGARALAVYWLGRGVSD